MSPTKRKTKKPAKQTPQTRPLEDLANAIVKALGGDEAEARQLGTKEVYFELFAPNPGQVIGKNGQNLKAMQDIVIGAAIQHNRRCKDSRVFVVTPFTVIAPDKPKKETK